MSSLRRLFERHPASVLWALIVGYSFIFVDAGIALVPHGPLRTALYIVASLVSLVPGVILWHNVGDASQVLLEELRRHGHTGVLVSARTARSYWQSAGFVLVVFGTTALYICFTT